MPAQVGGKRLVSPTGYRDVIARFFQRVEPAQVGRWFLSILFFFIIWEILGRSGAIISVVPVTDVMPVLLDQILSGQILLATFGTLKTAGVGFAIGAIVGVSIGVLIGVSKRWGAVLDPLVNGLFAAPMAMIIPVISVYLGLEFEAKAFLVFLFAVFVIIINTAAGIREVPHSVKEMARAFETSRSRMYRCIILPWAGPYILTGLRIGVGRSVQGAILAELFLRAQNLGLFIRNAQGAFRLEELLAAVFFITVLAASTMGLARLIEWRLLRWKMS